MNDDLRWGIGEIVWRDNVSGIIATDMVHCHLHLDRAAALSGAGEESGYHGLCFLLSCLFLPR